MPCAFGPSSWLPGRSACTSPRRSGRHHNATLTADGSFASALRASATSVPGANSPRLLEYAAAGSPTTPRYGLLALNPKHEYDVAR